jgi:hypothetical protein
MDDESPGASHRAHRVLSPARVVEGRRVGIEALDPRSGRSRLLASLHGAARPSAVHLGPWSFDEAVLDWGNSLLRAATPCDLLVVDELGRLELVLGQGWKAGLDAASSGAYRQALVVIRTDLLPLAGARWPHAEVVNASDAVQRQCLEDRLSRIGSPG